jgi:hypothetical protein
MPELPFVNWPCFEIGHVSMTHAAATALEEAHVESILLLNRHIHSDWGDLVAHDKIQNHVAVLMGQRLLSAYDLPTGKTIWILTEADRLSTVLLLRDPSGSAT